jgi:hypothetical protein
MWYYKGEEITSIEDLPPQTFGFVYRVIHKPSGKIYIGKKVLQFTRKAKLTKKDLAIYEGEKGRRPTYKQVISESDWKTYYGSHKEIMALIKEGKQSDFRREILTCVPNKKLLTYEETKALFIYEVLQKPNEYFNDNILGKFFRKDFEL